MASCVICSDARVQAVDALIVGGRSARSVAIELGLPPESMKRHARNHVVRLSEQEGPVADLDPLTELVEALRKQALGSANAGTAREYRLALAALTERNITPPAYDVLRDPEWIALRALILAALAPFPEARLAVASAIQADDA